MPVQVTILGLGQIGGSIGLALAEHKNLVYRVGHDREISISRKAEQMGAIDKVEINIPNAVEKADFVVLSLPVDQIQEMLSIIAPFLKENAVVMDTAPVKEPVIRWAKAVFPEMRHYVGLTPIINPKYLQDHDTGITAARGDLFQNGVIAIVTPPGIPSEAIKLATDLTTLLRAEHLFYDPVELDSLMAATHILPQLMGAALLNITVDQPGWRDGRKLAGRAYAEVTGPGVLPSQAGALTSAALLSQEHVVRVINNLVSMLIYMRDDIQAGDAKELAERLGRATDGRARWWKERQTANWSTAETAPPVGMPTSRDMWGRMFGFRRPKPKDESGQEKK